MSISSCAGSSRMFVSIMCSSIVASCSISKSEDFLVVHCEGVPLLFFHSADSLRPRNLPSVTMRNRNTKILVKHPQNHVVFLEL